MSRAEIDKQTLSRDHWHDPNAEFAARSGYRDFDCGDRGSDDLPAQYPVLFELVEPYVVADLRKGGVAVPQAYPDTTRFATAWLDECQYTLLRIGACTGIVKRWALQLPVKPLRPAVRMPPLRGLSTNPVPGRARKATDGLPVCSAGPRTETVIGVIDTGCPFADPRYLRRAGELQVTRILALWDQTDGAFAGIAGACKPPADFGRGAELWASDIDEWLDACRASDGSIDEDLCYRRAGYDMMFESFVHGAAVLDLAAGPLPLKARYPVDKKGSQFPPRWLDGRGDKASAKDIVFVQVARNAVDDSTSASFAMQVLDGLRYIARRAAGAKRVVVNLSDGTSRELHDGHSMLEDAIRDLVIEVAHPDWPGGPMELQLVVAAGNAHMQARHALLDALRTPSLPGACGADVAVMHLPVDNEQAVFLNIGIPRESSLACLRITPPVSLGCDPIDVEPGQVVTWKYDGEACFWVVVPPAGDTPVLALAAWSPTAICPDGRRSAPSGNWRIQWLGREGTELPLWISLAQKNLDGPASIRQAWFIDADGAYDPLRWMRDVQLDPDIPKSVIRRNATLSVPATMAGGSGVVAVGARVMRVPKLPPSEFFVKGEGRRSAYSSTGASALVPSIRRSADFAHVQAGIRAAGSPSGAVVSVTGTSFAAPQYVRKLANMGP